MTDYSTDNLEAAEPTSPEQLLPLVYGELRRLAAARLGHEKPGQTLAATDLVHEAYLRLLGSSDANIGMDGPISSLRQRRQCAVSSSTALDAAGASSTLETVLGSR